MKKFDFHLERVRQWREKQMALEELRLEQLFAEKSLVEARLTLLEQEARESASIVNRTTPISARELQATDAFRRFVTAQRVVFGAKLAECDRHIAEQQAKLMEARRRFELLGKLKDKQWKAWNIEFAREIEIQANEVYLANWIKN